jgi:hypothetical protein
MLKVRLPEIGLGFLFGVIVSLFFGALLSYQASHCTQQNEARQQTPPQKTPALNVGYFGKLYVPGPAAAVNQGMAYYAEHLAEALGLGFVLANVFPTERVSARFAPQGLELASLSASQEFTLWLSIHAKYEFSPGAQQIAEIGAVYMVQPMNPKKATFRVSDFGPVTPAILTESTGVRRIT